MRALKKATHRNRDRFKYQYQLDQLAVSGVKGIDVAEGAGLLVQVSRSAKVVTTATATVVGGKAYWGAPLEFVSTMYASKKSDKAFSEKEFKVGLLTTIR